MDDIRPLLFSLHRADSPLSVTCHHSFHYKHQVRSVGYVQFASNLQQTFVAVTEQASEM